MVLIVFATQIKAKRRYMSECKPIVTGGLFGTYPPSKYDNKLSEEIEVEEHYKQEDNMENNPALEKYLDKKGRYINNILDQLEEFTGRKVKEWTESEEGMIWDLLDGISNDVKATMSSNTATRIT